MGYPAVSFQDFATSSEPWASPPLNKKGPTMAEISHEIRISGKPEQVFEALTTLEGVTSWQTPHAEGTGVVGTEWVFTFTGRPVFAWEIIASESPDRVEWRCTQGPGDSVGTTARFAISPAADGRTLLELTHAGWPGTDGNFRKCNTIWGVLLYHIQQFVQTGTPATAFN
jgi:uncharacterized protein YndB with AHSA1/START domain